MTVETCCALMYLSLNDFDAGAPAPSVRRISAGSRCDANSGRSLASTMRFQPGTSASTIARLAVRKAELNSVKSADGGTSLGVLRFT